MCLAPPANGAGGLERVIVIRSGSLATLIIVVLLGFVEAVNALTIAALVGGCWHVLVLVFDIILIVVGLLGVPLVGVGAVDLRLIVHVDALVLEVWLGFLLILLSILFLQVHLRFLINISQFQLPLLFLLPFLLLLFDLLPQKRFIFENYLLLHQNPVVGIGYVLEHLVGLWELPQSVCFQIECHVATVHALGQRLVELGSLLHGTDHYWICYDDIVFVFIGLLFFVDFNIPLFIIFKTLRG